MGVIFPEHLLQFKLKEMTYTGTRLYTHNTHLILLSNKLLVNIILHIYTINSLKDWKKIKKKRKEKKKEHVIAAFCDS